jgi:hypothetical protein
MSLLNAGGNYGEQVQLHDFRLDPQGYAELCEELQQHARKAAEHHDADSHAAFHISQQLLHDAVGSLRPVPCFCPGMTQGR